MLFLQFSIESISNWVVLFTVDEFMRGITLSLETEIIVALLLAALEIIFEDKEDGSKQPLTAVKWRYVI
ncbi:YrvL family regulatory protein [Lentibacillus sp. CBA3610]|uniref:YrvL family regulatory protein n=1 Tax=Lentibacillus sp. CBA3610 TaxID=2518176 RepID=UPI001595C942|nr:YrvL family regulatory protein [Lentibacillus sp. CBA3610]QKY70736.1 hypothetical protein Len3610_15075 [Lentibacillus sp. CBA3610]